MEHSNLSNPELNVENIYIFLVQKKNAIDQQKQSIPKLQKNLGGLFSCLFVFFLYGAFAKFPTQRNTPSPDDDDAADHDVDEMQDHLMLSELMNLPNASRGHQNGCFLKWGYPTTMGFPTKNDHFGVFWGYHQFRNPQMDPSFKKRVTKIRVPHLFVNFRECILGKYRAKLQ